MSVAAPKVVGAAGLSGLGVSWRGLASAVIDRDGGEAVAAEVPIGGIAPDRPSHERLAARLMSRSALLAHLVSGAALADAGWETGEGALADVGFFMGVGASGGSVAQLEAMLAASVERGELSLEAFGQRGLRACNPLYAFQLMNNFTLCHAAILAGIRGPNAALFSRGGGTVRALAEAIFALGDPDERCDRALVGAADCATDPVTLAELARGGFIAEGLVPAEGAALLALSCRDQDEALAVISHCAVAPADIIGLQAAVASAVPDPGRPDAVVIAGWGPARRAELAAVAAGIAPDAATVDVTGGAGETLAASPALAWLVALELVQRDCREALVLSCGIDDELGAVRFRSADGGRHP